MTLYCSFCGKSQHEVRKLVAGLQLNTFICNECIALCVDVLLKELETDDMIMKLNKWIKEEETK